MVRLTVWFRNPYQGERFHAARGSMPEVGLCRRQARSDAERREERPPARDCCIRCYHAAAVIEESKAWL